MRGTCVYIEGTVQEIEGSQPCCKAYKVCLWSNTSGFLGHYLGQGMIGLQDVNVQMMRDAPRPTTKKEIRSLLGLPG